MMKIVRGAAATPVSPPTGVEPTPPPAEGPKAPTEIIESKVVAGEQSGYRADAPMAEAAQIKPMPVGRGYQIGPWVILEEADGTVIRRVRPEDSVERRRAGVAVTIGTGDEQILVVLSPMALTNPEAESVATEEEATQPEQTAGQLAGTEAALAAEPAA